MVPILDCYGCGFEKCLRSDERGYFVVETGVVGQGRGGGCSIVGPCVGGPVKG